MMERKRVNEATRKERGRGGERERERFEMGRVVVVLGEQLSGF